MYLDFSFWRHLVQPSSFTNLLSKEFDENAKVRGYKKCVAFMFIFTILLFSARNIWGMSTEGLTELLVTGTDDRYVVARIFSLVGTLLLGIVFFLFHYYFIPYIITALTDLPYKLIQKIQLYVIFFILVEKLVTFIVFIIVGFNTPFTFFSLAPMTAYLYYNEFLLFFLNQLTVATLITVFLQFKYLREWTSENKNSLLSKLILIQFTIALIIAAISVLPVVSWITRGLS